MLSEAKHPYWIDLTLSAGADVPLLVEGEGQKGEVCHPQLVMLSKAKHPQLDSSLRSDGECLE
jgi:hypothetical protein